MPCKVQSNLCSTMLPKWSTDLNLLTPSSLFPLHIQHLCQMWDANSTYIRHCAHVQYGHKSIFQSTFLAYILTFSFLIVLEFFKPFNKLADRVLSGIEALVALEHLYLIKHSCSFIKHHILYYHQNYFEQESFSHYSPFNIITMSYPGLTTTVAVSLWLLIYTMIPFFRFFQ